MSCTDIAIYVRMIASAYKFRKMNGLGNDFAVLDARLHGIGLDAATAARIADRRHGVGCDQVIVIEPSARADAFMRILNADGSEVDACGNATRCIAGLLAEENHKRDITIETAAGLLHCAVESQSTVTVNMGQPRLQWKEIPLSRSFDDTSALDVAFDTGDGRVLSRPGAVNVGNPHCIFAVENADAYDLAAIGPRIERDPLFPERANVSLAQALAPDRVRLRVWERGAGLTMACGTAACAAAVAMARKALTGRKVTIELPGGNLTIEWREADGHILMTGPWKLDYEGVFDPGERAARAIGS